MSKIQFGDPKSIEYAKAKSRISFGAWSKDHDCDCDICGYVSESNCPYCGYDDEPLYLDDLAPLLVKCPSCSRISYEEEDMKTADKQTIFNFENA